MEEQDRTRMKEAQDAIIKQLREAAGVREPKIEPRDFKPLPKLAKSKDGKPVGKMKVELPDYMKKMIAESRGIAEMMYETPHMYKPVAVPWWEMPVHLKEAGEWPATFTEGLMAQLETEDRLKVNKPKVYLHFI